MSVLVVKKKRKSLSPFIVYSCQRRPQVTVERQDLTFGQISKLLASEWNALTIDEKSCIISTFETKTV